MIARKLQTVEEYLAAEKISTIAFVGQHSLEDLKKEAEENAAKPHEQLDFWGAFNEDNVMTSHMMSHAHHVLFDGHIVLSAGIGNVSTLPEYRGQGGIRTIFKELFAECLKKGYVFSMLYPFSNEFYRKFGFETAYRPYWQSAEMRDLRAFDCPYTVKMHDWESGIEPLKAVYQKFILGHNMAVVRSEKQWDILESDAVQKKRYLYVLYEGETPKAYVAFRPEQAGNYTNRAVVKNMAWDSTEAFYGLLGFLGRLSAQYGAGAKLYLPSEVDLGAVLPEKYREEHQDLTPVMVRVLDVKRALTLMKQPMGQGKYILEVKDAFLPENEGRYAVNFANGAAVSVEKTEALPDMVCDVTSLSMLVMGTDALDTVKYRRDVRIFGNEDVLFKVFVKKNCYHADNY